MIRDVGSISNLGARQFEGNFYLKKKGAFSTNEGALLCLLQNLGGTCPQFISFSFHFHFIKESSPSTRVVLQGALHLKTLIYNYILKRIITI